MTPLSVLFVFTAESYHREAAPVVEEFVRKGAVVTVLLGFHSNHTEPIVEACRRQGITVETVPVEAGYGAPETSVVPAAPNGATKPTAGKSSTKSTILRVWIRKTGLARLLSLPIHLMKCLTKRRVAKAILTRHQPDAVIMGSYHSSGQIDNAMTRACIRQSVPMYCIPNSPYLGTLALRVARLNHLEQGMASEVIRVRYDPINRILAWLFPSWTSVIPDGNRVFYWDPLTMLAATLTGLQMNRLWLKPSLDFRKVFVHSEYSRELLLRDGYPADRIVVSGPPLLDAVVAKIGDPAKEKLLFSHVNLPVGSPFILFNVEPSAEHKYCDWNRHWRQFHELMASLVEYVESGLPVVLSLHPLCRLEDYRFAEEQYGVVICTDFRIHDLYPYCSISISFPCSTNLLALTFKKPLIIYDHFRILSRDEESKILNSIPRALLAQSASEIPGYVRELRKTLTASGVRMQGGSIGRRATEIIVSSIQSDVQVPM
ncbi:hypothetical protein PROAA_320056 [Candidatus Propionivibrio aalborgensis]|uniref:UDP-N-acetylglucosamine 2-epimerase domain-containing protein n=1 Tax=Candidatus Propionivibrio aalborgensis TaxID=1860101 RepID=A0A1A8XWN1_9RHOO|nr:hypothetical protein PROAA_320056 [Candidatus Propionivibrio aalborgensis]